MGAGTLDHPVEGVGEHKAKLSRVAVHCIDLRPPVQMRLEVDSAGQDMVKDTIHKLSNTNIPSSALTTYVSDYSVQRIDQDEVKGGRGGRGQADLEEKKRKHV